MATEKAEAELKTQGVIEAARDPESNVTAEDAKKKIVEESKKAGVAAFTFNADASPEEKAAKARDVSSAASTHAMLDTDSNRDRRFRKGFITDPRA